jgi:hypothetical protein
MEMQLQIESVKIDLESTSSASIDDQIRLKSYSSCVRQQRRGNGSHAIHAWKRKIQTPHSHLC